MNVGFVVFIFTFIGLANALTIGGYMRWRPIPGSTSAVVLETSTAFDGTTCLIESLSTRTWTSCSSCVIPGASSTSGTCIQRDNDKSWSVNYAREESYPLVESTITPTLTYREFVSFTRTNRILSTLIDTRARSDTGLVNSPPITVLRPVITVNSGCSRDVPISVHDDDGDNIRCRFITDTAVCGDHCTTNPNPHITLNETTCILTYNGAGDTSTADVVVNLAIEDFPTSDITVGGSSVTTSDRLSYVNLQFVIRIGAALVNCTALPALAEFAGGSVSTVSSGNVFSQTVSASSAVTVTKITGFGLVELSSTAVSSAASVYSSTFTWTATSTHVGDNTVCYIAEISGGAESDQKCQTVRVEAETGTTTPLAVDSTTGVTDATTIASTTVVTTMAEVTTLTATSVATEPVSITEVNPCLTSNGGCSDTCNWSSGTSVTCSCTNPCWHLAADGKNCIPEVHLRCSDGQAHISVDNCTNTGDISVNGFDSSSSSAPAACRPTHNSTHVNFQYDLNDCGSNIVDTSVDIQYENTVRFWSSSPGGTITRGVGYEVTVVCSFPKYNNLSSNIDPVDSFLNYLSVPGLGFFTFEFKFYQGSSFLTPHTADPVQYNLNSDVYFAIEATGGSGVRLFTQSCIAYPDVPDTTEQYALIEEGCTKDNTMQTYVSPNPMQNRFSVKAFRFVDSLPGITNETNVAIRCFVVVCVDDPSTPTRCSRGCVTSSARRRRDASQRKREKRQTNVQKQNLTTSDVFESIAHLVASVNLQVELEEKVVETPLDWKWLLLLIAASLGALFLLFSCCCCWWFLLAARKRRRRKNTNEKDESFDNQAFDLPKWLQSKVDQ